MRQKLPDKKFSYRNLYLGELRKTKILSDSWTKSSIKLLTTKFFKRRNFFASSFDFRKMILSINSYYSRKNKNFISNSLILFTLPFFISIYCSNTRNIIETKNFSLTKIQKQDHRRKDHMDIYKKSFRGLNKNFVDIFLHRISRRGELFKYKSIFDIIAHRNNQICFEEINYLVKKEKKESGGYGPNFRRKFLEFYLFVKELKNQDCFWLRSLILQNLQNWGESNEILVRCSLMLMEKSDSYLSNYLEIFLWRFLADKPYNWEEKIESDISMGEFLKYSYNELNNPNFCISLENILSYTIYQFSRNLVYAAKKTEIQVKDINLLTKKKRNQKMDLLDLHTIQKKVKINPQFFDFINLNKFSNSQIDYFNFQWITKIFYLNDKSVSKTVSMERTFLNKSLPSLKKKVNSYVNSSIDKFIINHLFSRHRQEKNQKLFFPKSLLVAEVTQNILSEKDLNKFSRKFQEIEQSKTYNQSDDIGIISWKIRQSHLNFLENFSLPSNDAYNLIRENSCLNKKIQYEIGKKSNQLLVEISELLALFTKSRFGKIFSLLGLIKLRENLIVKNNELTRVIESTTQIRNSDFTEKMPLLFSLLSKDNYGISNIKNELRESFLLLKNLIIYNSKNSSNLWNNLLLKLFNLNRTLYKYLQNLEKNFKKSFIYDIENIKYNELDFEISHWLDDTDKNLSRIIAPFNFPVEFPEILKNYFQNSYLNDINRIFDPLLIFSDIYSINIDQKRLFSRTLVRKIQSVGSKINNWIAYLFISQINGEIIIDSSTDLLNGIRNKKLLVHSNYKLDVKNSSINFRSNYREIFSFRLSKDHEEDSDIENDNNDDNNDNINNNNNNIIYLEFLRNFFKYNRLNRISLKQRFLFHEKEMSQVVQLKFNNFFFFGTSKKKFHGTKFIYFPDFHNKVLGQNISNFLEIENKKIGTLFPKNKIRIKETPKNLLRDLNNIGIRNYYRILQSESLTKRLKMNGSLFQAINKILLSSSSKYSKSKNLKYQSENEILTCLDEIYNESNKIDLFNFFKEKENSLQDYNYISWFFTSEWWKYNLHIFIETLQEYFIRIDSYFEDFTNNNIELIKRTLVNFYEEKKNLYILNSKWKSRFFLYHTEKTILIFAGSNFQSLNNFNNVYCGIFSLMAFFMLFYRNYFSIFIGSDSIDLWKHFENIQYLKDPSRALYFTEFLNRNKIQLNKTENLSNLFDNLKHYAKNIRFYILTKKELTKWLISYKNIDESRRKRNVLVQSLITSTQIEEYGFQLYYQPEASNNPLFGYRRNHQQGLSYLRYLSRMLKKKLVNYPIHLADKWLFFASLQKIISSQIVGQTKKYDPRFQRIPVPLQLGLSCSRGVLLIGPVETGRSYLIKNLAADSSVPLLGISINKLLYNKPDIITESWMNILIQSLRRLNLILDLAKGMSPCIIWIRDIHQLDVDRSTQNIESDPTFLLGILSKYFQIDSLKSQTKKNIIIVGSTHVPKRVDPSLISPDRLDRVLNIRLLNIHQRKNQFPILLNKNNLQLNKNFLYFKEFGSRTMGYNIRDLAALTNETSLISITKNKLFVYHDILKLAFHRQVFGFSHINNKPNYQQNFKILLYKIGRAIIQNILIEGFATNPLTISNYLWKKKFYYLSKWYSESSLNDPIIKESTVLIHVSGSLAGIAARDSWFVLEKDSSISISLDKSVENDLDLASSLLENFSNDFTWLETCENQSLDYRKKKSNIFLMKDLLHTPHNGIFSVADGKTKNNRNESQQYKSLLSRNDLINKEIGELNNTAWSPRFWRLGFSRNHLFNWIKKSNNSELFDPFGSSNKNDLEERNQNYQFMKEKKEQLLYERILPRVRKRNVEELESQFESILLEENSEILGFFDSSTQYQMEYQMDNKPRLFIGKRILWDPINSLSQIRNFVFSRRKFFVDEEMLRRLYITYGVRRERERSLSSHRIKQFFICRGYNKDLINKLSIRWWTKLPLDEKQNIYTLGQIEKIGIRLERPQIFTPVYLYQRWLIENIPEKFSRLNLLIHRARWVEINKLFLDDSFTYKILLESYQYLFEFFSSNKKLVNEMTKILLNKKWIFQNQIKHIIRDLKNSDFY